MRLPTVSAGIAAATAVVAAAALTACADAFVTEVDVDLPEAARELVVEAYLRPDDTSFVYVSRTVGILDPEGYDNVSDAAIALEVDGEPVATFAEAPARLSSARGDLPNGFSEYAAVLPAERFAPGARFRLTATAPGGETVVAEEVVPAAGRLRSVSVTEREFDGAIAFTIEDAAGASGYLVEGTSVRYFPGFDPETREPNGEVDSSASPLDFFTGEDFDYLEYGERFTTGDAGFEGGAGSFRLGAYFGGGGGCFGEECADVPRPKLRLRLRTINPAAVEYLQALRQAAEAEFNPFVEPVVIPSAFEGGRGVLAVMTAAEEVELELGD